MKTIFSLLLLMYCLYAPAQTLCPGGAVGFQNIPFFDPAWTYGCNTGTSCNGGVSFDNRVACQPFTAMTACAPPPSCGRPGDNASNLWYRFFASETNVTIACVQNSSLVLGIQGFAGGTDCGSLVQLGCAVSTGPSGGVKLHLTGLVPGTIYYFRVFGSASTASQRTGLYCFCGTVGLTTYLLSANLLSFRAEQLLNKVNLVWSTSSETDNKSFEIESSQDARTFTSVGTVKGGGNKSSVVYYNYTDFSTVQGARYYRLKMTGTDGSYTYSGTVAVNSVDPRAMSLYVDAKRMSLRVTVRYNMQIDILSMNGTIIKKGIHLKAGSNTISVADLKTGIYFILNREQSLAQKFQLY